MRRIEREKGISINSWNFKKERRRKKQGLTKRKEGIQEEWKKSQGKEELEGKKREQRRTERNLVFGKTTTALLYMWLRRTTLQLKPTQKLAFMPIC